MIERASLEKSLPRLASAAPFLCLIDDHLLCPDISALLDGVEEARVHAAVVGEFGGDSDDEETPVARGYRVAIEAREHLDTSADLLDPRRADEHRLHRLALARELELGLEGRDLAAEGVAPDADVHEPQVVAIEHDHAGAGPEHRPG